MASIDSYRQIETGDIPLQEVHYQEPATQEPPSRQAYSGQTIPNLIGLSLREAAATCSSLDLNLSYKGTGKVVAQRPKPGTRLHPDMVCEVFFAES